MMKCKKRVLTLLLALCMLLSLAACGSKDKGDDTQQLSATVYVPEFLSLDLDILGKNYNISGGCTDGTNVYLLAYVYPDYEAGEEGDSRTLLIRFPLDGGEPTEMKNFQSGSSEEDGAEVNRNFNSLRTGIDGSLWLEESTYSYVFDLPEDFDEETDSKYNYTTDTVRKEYQVQLDSTGTEITRIDTSDLQEKAGVEGRYQNGLLVDKDGDIFITDSQKIVVLDSSMNVRFTVEDSNMRGGSLVELSDGSIGATVYVTDAANQSTTAQLRTIDKAAKGWAEKSYDLPLYASYNLYSGGGDYLFYYMNGDALYGYRAEAEEGKPQEQRLLSWLESDINADNISFFSFLSDGRVVVMTESWYGGNDDIPLAILTETDRSELPEKTTLTYATMGISSDERSRILEFNRNSSTHRIQITDYSEYSTEDDYTAGITKLNTEILAGKVPDIIVSSLPIRQYGAKGILEDLWPYIENDTEIGGREGVMERVFQAAEQDGKLYQVFDTFGISTVIGSRKQLGDRTSWTMAELKEALASMPEGCAIFGEWDTKESMLSTLLRMNLDSYVNWQTGECGFDSDSFKSVLEFCNSFPTEYTPVDGEYDDENSRISEGRQMLSRETLSGFENIQLNQAIFGGADALNTFYLDYSSYPPTVSDVPVKNDWGYSDAQNRVKPGQYLTYIGYPREDGRCGSAFEIYSGLAMSSSCKDKEGAWQFMRELLLPWEPASEDERWGWNHWGFAANKEQFEKNAAEAMKVEYMTDGEGNPILDLNGDPIQESSTGYGMGDLMVNIQATSQEEYDQVMDLYNAIDTLASSDSSIYDIVNEVAGSYFAGDRSLDDAAALIQNKVTIYVNESR